MAHDRTQPATPAGNPIATGEYVAGATPDPGSTLPTGQPGGGPSGDLPDVPGYLVSGEIARGGMGRVLAATDLAFDREVAVKVMLPGYASGEAAGRFVRESRITGRLAHPGIPPAYELGQLADGTPFLAMKLVRGRTLADLLKDRTTPAHDLSRFVGVFEQIAQAVGFAHSEGVIHRDLKPANVMVGAFGEVQVMDWGLAREASEERGVGSEEADPRESSSLPTPHSPLLTAQGAVMGTPAYMAPEQARGEDVDARADVFALGGILCEVLTGTRPFRGTSGAEVVRKAAAGDLSDTFARLDACGADRELIDVAKRCLSADPSARPADGTATARLVGTYRVGVEERLQRAERDRAAAEARAAEQRKRRRVQLALAAAVVLMVAGAGAGAVWRVREVTRLEGEEHQRQTRAEDAVETLLGQAKVFLEAGDADRAGPFLDQAARRAAGDAVETRADRVAAYQRDLAMLRELDAVDTFRLTPAGSNYPPDEEIVGRWAAAVAGYGIVPGVTPPGEAAARLADTPIREALLGTLDGWLARVTPPRADHLRAILDAADSDPFRSEVRARLAAADRAGLAALVGRVEWADQPARILRAYAASPAVPEDDRRKLLIRATTRRPSDFGLLVDIGQTYPLNSAAAAAERARWFQAATSVRPLHFSVHNGLGNALRDKGDADGAAAAYREAIRLNPRYAPAHVGLGNALADKRDRDGAIVAYREAIRHDPGYSFSHYNLGISLAATGDAAGAEAAYREAIRLNPTFAHPHHGLGLVLATKGDPERAIAAHREAIRLDPRYAPAYHGLATRLAAKGDPAGAVAAYRAVIGLDPKAATAQIARYAMGAVLRKTGDTDGAVTAYREAARIDPDAALPHFHLGSTFHDKKDLPAAVAEYREAVRLDPKLTPAYVNLGNALRAKGEAAGAVAAYREAIHLDPKHANAHFNLGLTLKDHLKDLPGAVAAFREVVRLDPKHTNAHFNLGLTLKDHLNDLPGAAAAYREVVRLDPKHVNAHYNLGRTLRELKDLAGSAAALREVVRLDPKDADAFNELAITLLRDGKPAEAVPPAREAVRLDPTTAAFHATLGGALLASGDASGAAALAEAARLDSGAGGVGGLLSGAKSLFGGRAPRPEVAPPPREVKR